MRPPYRHHLHIVTEAQTEARQDQFHEALRELIEVVVRSEIDRCRTRPDRPPPTTTSDEDDASL